jgi:hypothetical protein
VRATPLATLLDRKHQSHTMGHPPQRQMFPSLLCPSALRFVGTVSLAQRFASSLDCS